MEIFQTFKSPVPKRSVLSAALLAAISALLIVIAPVSAEATDGAIATPTEAVEIPASVEQSETSASEAAPETAPPVEAVAPVEPQAVTNTVDSAGTAVEDVSAAVATADNSPVAKPSTQTAASSASALVDSVADAAASADPAGDEPLEAVGGRSEHRLPGLVENVLRGSAQTIESIGRGSAEAIAPVTARLPAVPALSAPELVELLDPVSSVTPETLLPASGPSQAGQPAAVVPANVPAQPQAGFFSLLGMIASGGESVAENPALAEFGKGGASARLAPGRPSDRREAPTLVMPRSDAGFAARINHLGGSPAPLDVPPTPESPKAIAPGSGDSFFPIVALLALLALVAPAIPRRLAEGADFRPPTPFVCALERPG